MKPEKKITRIVPAVDRAARILGVIQTQARPMSITELAIELNASKGTIREILETLRGHGLLFRDDETKRYQLGPELVKLGASSRERQEIMMIARPILANLSDTQRENVLLLAIQEDRLLIQEAFEPNDPQHLVLVSATPGRSMPITAGSCGKVVMIWGDEDARAHLATSFGNMNNAFKLEIETARKNGYTLDDQEFIEGVRGVCAPILDSFQKLAGLVLLSGLAGSIPLNRLDHLGNAVRDAAESISNAIGGPGITAPGKNIVEQENLGAL